MGKAPSSFIQDWGQERRLEALRKAFGEEARLTAARRVAVSNRYGFIYNRIQKNANSSLMVFMHRIERGRFASVIRSRSAVPHLSKMSPEAIARAGAYRRMVVVRDPYSRVLSAFLEKFQYDRIIERHGAFERTPDGFGSFLDWLESGGLDANPHWDLQCKQMLLPLDRYSDVIRFEALSAGMGEFTHSLSIKGLEDLAASSFDHARKHATGADDRIRRFYTPARAEQVRRLYRSDFDALGYSDKFPKD